MNTTRRRPFPILGILALALFQSLDSSLAAQQSLLINGSFEEGGKGWWGPGLKAEAVLRTNPAAGNASLKVVGDYVCQDKIPIASEQRYKLTLKIRCDGAPAGSVTVQSSYRGSGVPQGWFGPTSANGEAALLVTGGTHDWKTFTVVVEAPEGADQFLLYLRKTPGTPGAACFAAVSLVPTAEPLTPDDTESLPTGVVQNGDFEQGKAGWWGQGTWNVVTGPGTDGNSALKVEQGFVCQDKIRVKEKKCYRVTMRIRTEGANDGAVYVQTSYRGRNRLEGWHGPTQARGEAALFVSGGTHAWQTVSVVVQAPPTANQLLLYLRKQAGPGVAYYDDIHVEETSERPFTAADKRRGELAAELLPTAANVADVNRALEGAVALGSQANAKTFVLAAAGKAACRIHVASEADVVTLGAVKELVAYLTRMSGASFLPISHDANLLSGPLLVVGRDSPLTAKLCPEVDYAKLGDDGFIVRSVGAHLVIAGATPRGTMYGVNWFLDHQLGVKWVNPDYTHVPSQTTLAVPSMNETQVPHFSYREVLSAEGSQPAFAAHNLLNGRSHGPSFAPTAPELDCWVQDWMAKGGSASFLELLPQSEYGKEHPEWYAGGQVAMMNKEMRKAMAKEVIRRLQVHPDYTKIWFNIWQMDWGWDMDTASKTFAEAHGGQPSAPRLDMMRDIAEQVRAKLPGARLAFNAYHWGFTPPVGLTVPDHLLVFPMTIHVDYRTPLNQGRNGKLGNDLVGWTKLARNVQVWDHIANWAGFIQPTPNIYPIGASIRWLAESPGFRGYFAEGNWNSPGGEFSDLRAWLIARLTWDPQQDCHKLVREFCNAYYGKAGPIVARYIDLMHETAAKNDDILGQRYLVDLPLYDLDFVQQADQLFAQAQIAVADHPQHLAHVLKTRMTVDYVILMRRQEYAEQAAQRKLDWKLDMPARRDRFKKAVADHHVTEYRQGGSTKELLEMIEVERHTPAPHPKVAGLPRESWREISDMAFMRFDSAALISDAAASDGAAIRMVGNSGSWAMQLPMSRVPRGGVWELYADLRVDALPGFDDQPGAQVGSAPPFGLINSEKIGVLNDGHYHLIKVPGGPFAWDGDNRMRTVYVQSPDSKVITYVYLDRLIAIRVPKQLQHGTQATK